MLKSIVAALIESSGESRAAVFVRDFIITQLADKDLHEFWEPEEPIKLLSEILARDGIEAPEPRLIGNSGKNTILACFRVGLYNPNNKQMIGLGELDNFFKYIFTYFIIEYIVENRFWRNCGYCS